MEVNNKYNERDWILKRWTQFPPLPCDKKLFVMILFQDCSLLHACPLGSICRNGICTENFGRNTHPDRVEKVSDIFLTRGWRVSFVPTLLNFNYENDIPMVPDLILAMPYQPSTYPKTAKEYKKLHRLISWAKDRNQEMIFIIRDCWLTCVETDLALTWDFFKQERITPMQTAYVNYCSLVASEYVHTVIKNQQYQYSVRKYDLILIVVSISYHTWTAVIINMLQGTTEVPTFKIIIQTFGLQFIHMPTPSSSTRQLGCVLPRHCSFPDECHCTCHRKLHRLPWERNIYFKKR